MKVIADLPTWAQDVNIIIKAETSACPKLNSSKCEIIVEDFSQFDQFHVFKDIICVPKDSLTLLEVPSPKGKALEKAIWTKVEELERTINHLKLFWAHDVLVL